MTATRPADVAGGLEVRKTHRGTWQILLGDGTPVLGDLCTLPRQRNARAVRALLLGALPDWSGVTDAGRDPGAVTAEQWAAASQVAGMVRRVCDRRSRGVRLCCGCRSCVCGTDRRPDGPHYTAAELEWTQ
ncbi:hypothetical protein BBK14_11400 [Parafrankia soli]|uniref:Uncharacterized protein n=1 Tax=Parafrankia soli TaxID=2599596 RepID=A0A1S1R914_9ACTN|nr:hypothetical protein [Parafrankia soli]OHV42219.1 hypothetical protein BBK14_11400 [Parafrankia soli]